MLPSTLVHHPDRLWMTMYLEYIRDSGHTLCDTFTNRAVKCETLMSEEVSKIRNSHNRITQSVGD